MDADRQSHTEKYRGHELSVGVQQEGTRWTWWYVIDGKVTGQCATHAKVSDADVAMRRAISAARARADELKR